ncbi:poly [ADP-ribose] polymerase tankyrase-like isoform X2 [Littorina saxatilis]|uniref:poly [ADP-ribose] polymerase tankyrase-like isoform X2 n=1 Tax=Littorina saxatilis TaxID=31220 RepID=UPI0038B519EC
MEKEGETVKEEMSATPGGTDKAAAESGGSGGGSGGKRKRTPQKVEKVEATSQQRTPLKRQRNPVKLFQSPAELEKAALKTPKPGPSKEETQVLYKKGTFLALRGDDESFFLCRVTQNVCTGKGRQFKLNWLSLTKPPNTYKLDYVDKAEMDSILTNVRMDRVSRDVFDLPADEKARIDTQLNKTMKFVRGEEIEEEMEEAAKKNDVSENEEEEAEESSDEEPPAKKQRGTPKAGGSKKKTPPKTKAKTAAQKKKEKEKEKKRKLKEKGKKGKGPDRNLNPNPKIKVLEKDPFFEAKDNGPFVSVPIQSRKVFAAINSGNVDRLKELLESDQVYRLDIIRSPGVHETPLELAIRLEKLEMIDLLVTDILDRKVENKRHARGPPVSLMEATGTGQYNPVFLGRANIRALNVGRGSREGNNAFTKDDDMVSPDSNDYIRRAIELGVKPDTLDRLVKALAKATARKDENNHDEVMEECFRNIHIAIENGHRQTAAKLVSDAVRVGGYGYNFLHEEVLKFEKENLRDHILAASVRKKPFDNRAITPLHCAAINPNPKYLTRLLSVEPDINLMDRSHRRPIHYAAACTDTKPLEFLLTKGASPNDVDTQGNLPLHRACIAGRAHNVTVLLKNAEFNKSGDDQTITKWGIGGIDRSNRNSYCPIHIAVMNGHIEVLKVLLKNKVNVNKQVSAGKNKLSPLMMAAELGNLDMVRLLVQSGATVELLDKLKRSALMHAVINGNTNVASYLLYLGADPNRTDSSGNSLVHYAAAFGWYHCLKLLVKDAGATYNSDNDWKTTPLAIAFLKGQPGIVDYLLNLPDTDINFQDEKGMTLVSIAASSQLQKGLDEQIKYLVMDKKANPTIPDLEGYTALHHLCANNIKLKGSQWAPAVCDSAMETSVKIAHILLDRGCDVSQASNVGKTPVSLALEQVNSKLVQLLVQQGGEVPTEKNKEEKNVLHIMAEQCCKTSLTQLLLILAGQTPPASGDQKSTGGATGQEKMEVDQVPGGAGDASSTQPSTDARHSLKEALKKMAGESDFLGFTPLLRACQVYRTYQVPRNPVKNQVESEQQNGRDFIQALLEVAGADVNASVKGKILPDTKEPVYAAEGMCGTANVGRNHAGSQSDNMPLSLGKYTATHMMVSCAVELPITEDEEEIKHPGLALILRFKPNLELGDKEGNTPLVLATHSRNAEKVKILLTKGANPNVSFKHMYQAKEGRITPCLWLAMRKDLALVRLFLKHGANAKAVEPESNKTLMHYLAYDRSSEAEVIELLKELVQKGLSVNDKAKDNTTALHIAVTENSGDANSSTALEEFLLSNKADVFAKTNNGVMPIHCVFVQCASDPIELLSLMTAAMKDQHVDEPDSSGDTPLHKAAAKGATICCMHLLQRRAQIDRKNAMGNTPLTLAVRSQKDSCAIMLLQQGANVNDEIIISVPSPVVEKPSEPKPVVPGKKEKPVLKWRPLQQLQLQKKEPAEATRVAHSIFQGAISSELQGVAHLLLDKTGLGFSAIEAALNVNKFNVVLRLLKRVYDNSRLLGVNKDKQTLFHVLASKTKPGAHEDLQLQVAKMLLQKGVPVNTVDSQGCTPVQYCAIYHQPVPLARLLIENSTNWDVKVKDKMGRDLVGAVVWDYEWVSSATSKAMAWLDLLIEKGLSLDTLLDRPLPDPILFGARLDTSCPDYFTTRGTESITPLILAIRHYNFGLARYLLKKGASPNRKDSMGYTPLIHTVKMNDMTMVRLLLDYDYIHDKEEEAAKLVGMPTKPILVKKFSRNIFLIRPEKRAEEMERDPSDDEDGGEDEEENDEIIEEGIEDEEAEEDFIDEGSEDAMEPLDVEMNGVMEEEEEEEEGGEEDSDHDTDVMDDEEEEEEVSAPVPEPPQRLGSKQKSLVKMDSKSKPWDLPEVSVKSSLDIDIADPQGMTAFHHAVFSLEYGSFDNGEIIKLLIAAKGNPSKPDMKGELPKDSALMRGALRIYEALQRNTSGEKPSYTDFTVADGLLADGAKIDFARDAEDFLTNLDKGAEGEPANARPKVDCNCEMRITGEVYCDEAKSTAYDITLQKVDVAAGPWGMYNFYKLQIVRQKAKDMYVLFTRWGRIGDRGQWQHTPFPNAEDAVKEFCKVFRQKTANDWNHLDKFKEHPKKYRLMPNFETPKRNKEVKFELKSSLPSKLNPAVQDLLQELTSVNMLQAAAKSKGLDEDVLPFGRISRCNLDKAKDVLLELEQLIATVDLQQKNLTTTPHDQYQANCEKIATLTNEFYQLVPVGGFEYEAIRPVRDKKVLKEHFRLLSDLIDMEVASRILLGTQRRLAEMNPLDYIYRGIGCKIQPLNENEHETQYILTYINASGHGCKVNAVYKVGRAGEAEGLKELGLHNNRLLWHGTSMANIVSILHRGLLVSPPDAPKTGNLFGEGVYFADCFTKSRNYCYNAIGSCKVMLLCQVALGNSLEDFSHDEEDHHDEDVHSLKILGKMVPDPDFDIVLPYGTFMPLGQLKHIKYEGRVSLMQHNEYVIHNPKQICVRYMIMFDG